MFLINDHHKLTLLLIDVPNKLKIITLTGKTQLKNILHAYFSNIQSNYVIDYVIASERIYQFAVVIMMIIV